MITLTGDQMASLQQAQKLLHDVLPGIDALEACGEDCQALRAQNAAIRDKINRLYQQHGNQSTVPSGAKQ